MGVLLKNEVAIMSKKILIPTPLRPFVNQQEAVETNASTVNDALKDLVLNFPKLEQHLYDNDGNLTSRGIIYPVFETSEYRRCLPAATATADANPDSDVRVILYKQYIKAVDAPENFMETLHSVKNYWDSQLAKYSTVHFNGAKIRRGNCHLYGAVPSLRSLHDLNELIFVKPNGEWEQK